MTSEQHGHDTRGAEILHNRFLKATDRNEIERLRREYFDLTGEYPLEEEAKPTAPKQPIVKLVNDFETYGNETNEDVMRRKAKEKRNQSGF